ncbi:MAG TPA: MDR family MFS transporter [Gammaproteobacteria bacterium]|nr:MDR family MFS transporter [Gammaproteobacteria bacterium]
MDSPDDNPGTHRGWILAALMLTEMLAAMDTTIVSTAVPQIVGDLGGFTLFSWLFSIYLLAQTATIPVYGKLADLFGRKPVLIVGTLIFLAGSAACAGAWNMVPLIAFRGLQGLGAGSIMATVNTIAGDLYSVRERARVQGWLSSVWGMAAIVGPTLGGAFAEYASWRWIFLINLPIGIAAIIMISRFLHEQGAGRRHHIDFAGAALMMLAGSAVILGLLQGGHAWAWISAPSIGVFGIAALLIGGAFWVERRSPEPIMPGWVWRRRTLVGSNLAAVGMGIVMMGPNTYLPTFAQSVLSLGAIAAGLVLASMSIGWPIASSWSGRLYLRIGFRDAGLLGALLMFAASVGFVLLPYPGPIWAIVADQIMLGAGFGLLSTPLLVGIQSAVTWRERGVITSANIWSRYLGQSLGAAVVAAIFNATMRHQLQQAPASLSDHLPAVNDVINALQSGELGTSAEQYLRMAFYTATHHVYAGVAVAAVLTLGVVFVAPRKFPIAEKEG